MARRPDDEGATSVFAFVVAGAILLGSVGTVFMATTQVGSSVAADGEAERDLRADAILDRWLSQAGVAWPEGEDGTLVFAESGVAVDWDALERMAGADIPVSSGNEKFDYEEARDALGLDELGADVHLRIQEILTSPDLSGLRVGYIGDWEEIVTASVLVAGDEEMVAEAQAQLNLSMGAATGDERGLIDASGVQFTDRVHLTASYAAALVEIGVVTVPLPDHIADTSLLEGDVYPDLADYLDGALPDRLPEYDVLVIGSDVSHEELGDADLEGALQQFVQDGGAIVAFGTSDMRLDWSDDLLDDGKETANRVYTTPDRGHAVLQVPHDLEWLAGHPSDATWPLTALGGGHTKDRAQLFQVVLGDEDAASLAVTRTGAVGDGHVLFAGHRPADLIEQVGQEQAQAYVENMIGYFALKSLDFGATLSLSDGASVASAQRMVHATDEVSGQDVLRVTLHYWER